VVEYLSHALLEGTAVRLTPAAMCLRFDRDTHVDPIGPEV
jgi:hypothetical protein